jgi:hypothetical protein
VAAKPDSPLQRSMAMSASLPAAAMDRPSEQRVRPIRANRRGRDRNVALS